MKLKDIYRPEIFTVDVDDSLTVAARRMDQAQVGALVVLDGGRLAGIITERDVVRATSRAAYPARAWVSAHASSRPETAAVEEDASEVAQCMLDLRIRHLPVTAADGRLVGMVSIRDLLAAKASM